MLPKRQLNDGVISFLQQTPKAPSEDIYILFDRDLNNVGYLNAELVESREIEGLNGKFSLYFDYPANAENKQEIKEGHFIAHPDADLFFQLYEIKRVIKTMNASTEVIRAESKHIKEELGTEKIINATVSSKTLEESALIALDGTLWELGFVFNPFFRTYQVEDLSPLEMIELIQDAYECEVKWRIVITGSNSIRRFVDFLPRRGTDTVIEFEFAHNLQGIKIETDTSNLVTALYGRGQGTDIDPETGEIETLDFFDFVWQESLGDPVDKPNNQGWLGDETARSIYGKPDGAGGRKHIFGVYNSQAESQEGLIQETWRQVQLRKEPSINIEATVADLEKVSGYEGLKIRLGDTCQIKVPQFDTFLSARVIEIDRNKQDPSQTIVELGNFKPLLSEQTKRIEGSVQRSDASRAVHNRAGLFEPDTEQEGFYKLDKLLIGTDAQFTGTVIIDGDLIVGGSGVLSKFQFESSSESPGVISQGWGDFGIARSGGDFFKGRVSIPVRVPNFFEITKATVILLAMPIFFHGFDTADSWRQSRSLKFYSAPAVEGFLEYIDASGSSNVFFRQGTDQTNSVFGVNTWSPTLSYAGTDPFNTQNKIQTLEGDITSLLQTNRNINFYAETTLSESTWDTNHGLGKIIVRVEGYAKPQN